jgi:SAM-dependent methyltransferase
MSVSRLDAAWYPGFEDEWDAREFRSRILAVIKPDSRVLDIGAGRGAQPHMHFKGRVAEMVGSDIAPAVLENTQLDRAVHTPDGRLTPLPSDYFDVVISKHVLEHVADPVAFFTDVARVLKPGGLFLAVTPGGAHYVTVGARLTPLWFHQRYNKARGTAEIDVFPTVYRANSRRDLRRLASQVGLEIVEIKFQEGRPEYLRFNAVTYFVGMVYERLVNALRLDDFKVVLYLTARKPQGQTTPSQGPTP